MAHAEAREDARGLLHLLLVDHDAVGFLQHRFQQRMRIFDRLAAVLARDERRNHAHRPRPIERDHGDEFLDLVDLELPQQVAHAFGFDLEHAHGVAARQQLVGFGIVQRQVVRIRLDARRALHVLAGLAHHRQRLQAQEVHLQQARFFQRHRFPLRNDVAVLVLRQRNQLDQGFFADDDARRVRAGLPRHVLQRRRELHDFLRERLGPARVGEIEAVLLRAQQRGAGHFGNHLREAVAIRQRDFQRAADVADERLGAERAVGHDLRHAVRAVFLPHVFDHFAAARLAEIDVEVRRRHAFRIQEALEDQPVAQRIDAGDADRVGHQAPRARAAARAHRHAHLLGRVNEVPHHQEVVQEARLLDHAQFVEEPCRDRFLAVVLGVLQVFHPVELADAFRRDLRQVLLVRQPVGAFVVREMRILLPAQRELHVAALGDLPGVFERFRQFAEELAHFRFALQVELVGPVLHAVRLAPLGLRLQAQEHFVRFGVVGRQVVHVVRRHQRQAQLARQRDQLLVHRPLLRQAVVLHLEIKPVLAQDLGVFAGEPPRLVVEAVLERLGHLALQARGERDQALMVFRQQRAVDARLVVVAVEVRLAHQLHQVREAAVVLRQQHQVVRLPPVHQHLLAVVARRDVDLAAQDRLDAVLARGLVEMHRAEQIAVVGDRQRHLPLLLRPLHDRALVVFPPVQRAQPIQQAVLGVHVQMGEFRFQARLFREKGVPILLAHRPRESKRFQARFPACETPCLPCG